MATTLPNTAVHVDRVGARELLMPTRVLAIALLVGHLPLLIVHVHNLFQHRPHYEFVPFLLVAAAILAWKRRPAELTPVGPGGWLTGWGTLACSMSMLAVATLVHSPWLAAVSSILSCGGLILITTGRRGVAELLPVWLLLWLTVPPPFLLDRELIQFLQTLTSESSSQLMQWLEILHFRAGNVFRLPGQMLFVAEACSGVHSQLILVAAAALLGVGRRRSLVHVACLMLAALFWSIVANVARVTIVVAGVSRGWPLAEGWPHELLGYALVLLGFLAILSTDVLLRTLLAPLPPLATDESEGDDIDGMPRDRLDLSLDRLFHACWNRVVSGEPSSAEGGSHSETEAPGAVERFLPKPRLIVPGTAGVCGLLCVGLASLQIMAMMSTASDPLVDGTTLFASVQEESMPDRIDGWQRVGHETGHRDRMSSQGEFSHVWTYGRDAHSVRYAMDFPFVGWHQLTLCYQGQGWDVLSETTAQDRMGNEYVHAVLSRPTGECAVLCFSLHRADGSTLAPQFRRISFREKLRTNPVVSRILGQQHIDPDRCTAQFQQLIVTPALPGPDELMEARRLFERARVSWLEAGLLPGQQPRPQPLEHSAGLATGGHRP